MKSTVGEVVEVGGHIVRSTGRKDRHSKVPTSKGPRDRRLRLSAHTAIEFYDVQDRLGYDRPSKAVDWLIQKAKPSIDKLIEKNAESSGMAIGEQSESSSSYKFLLQKHFGDNPGNHFSSLPHPITSGTSSSVNFQSHPPDVISSTNNSTQNLGLSLHSFHHHPGLMIPWESQQEGENHAPSNENQTFFAVSTDPVGFENHYQRILAWNNELAKTDQVEKVELMVNSEQFLGQGLSSAFSQTGTLHSSFSPSVRSWNEIPMASSEDQRSQTIHQWSFCNISDSNA